MHFAVMVCVLSCAGCTQDIEDSSSAAGTPPRPQVEEGSMPQGQNTQDESVETAQRVRFVVVDRASKKTLPDCRLNLKRTSKTIAADQWTQTYDADDVGLPALIAAVEAEDYSGSFSVECEGQMWPIDEVSVLPSLDDQLLTLRIVIRKYARIITSLKGGAQFDLPSSCRVSSCMKPNGISTRSGRALAIERRIPSFYRRLYGKNQTKDFHETVSTTSLNQSLEILVPTAGEYFVEAMFGDRYRGGGRLIAIKLGEMKRVEVSLHRKPRLTGLLLGSDQKPLPFQRFLVRAKGFAPKDGLLVIPEGSGLGLVGLPDGEPITMSQAIRVMTDDSGRFDVGVDYSRWFTLEGRVLGQGGFRRHYRTASDDTDVKDLVIRLRPLMHETGIVQVATPQGDDAFGEKIEITQIAGSPMVPILPLVRIEPDNWLDTRHLQSGCRYRASFESGNYQDIEFVCKKGTQVKLTASR